MGASRDLADERGAATELGDGYGDISGGSSGRLDEPPRLRKGHACHVRHEVDQHFPERHHQLRRRTSTRHPSSLSL